jgi:hypothetical protein
MCLCQILRLTRRWPNKKYDPIKNRIFFFDTVSLRIQNEVDTTRTRTHGPSQNDDGKEQGWKLEAGRHQAPGIELKNICFTPYPIRPAVRSLRATLDFVHYTSKRIETWTTEPTSHNQNESRTGNSLQGRFENPARTSTKHLLERNHRRG